MKKFNRGRGMFVSSLFIVAGFLLVVYPWKAIGVYLLAYAVVIQWEMAERNAEQEENQT